MNGILYFCTVRDLMFDDDELCSYFACVRLFRKTTARNKISLVVCAWVVGRGERATNEKNVDASPAHWRRWSMLDKDNDDSMKT